MSNKKIARLLIVSSLAVIASLGSPMSSPAQSTLAGLGLYGAVFTSYTGACGGWFRDDVFGPVCCTFGSRPTCDDDGACSCSPDDYCMKFCDPETSCFEQDPECVKDQDQE